MALYLSEHRRPQEVLGIKQITLRGDKKIPFKEIKPPSGFIRINKRAVTISVSLIHFFEKVGSDVEGQLFRVKIFHDEKEKLVGLKPDKEGYKIGENAGSYRFTCIRLSKIAQGEFHPKWSEEHKMLIFNYGPKVDQE